MEQDFQPNLDGQCTSRTNEKLQKYRFSPGISKITRVKTYQIRNHTTYHYMYSQIFQNQLLPTRKCHFGGLHRVQNNFLKSEKIGFG